MANGQSVTMRSYILAPTEWIKKHVSDEYKRGDRKIVNQQNFLGVSNMHIRKMSQNNIRKMKSLLPFLILLLY